LEGEIKIRIPVIPELEVVDPNLQNLAKNGVLVTQLETTCIEWEQRILNILEKELPKVKNDNA